jgi:hypothetical protein
MLTQVDSQLFEGIYLDAVYVHIGNKKFVREPSIHIGNQINNIINKNFRKSREFALWLRKKFNIVDGVEIRDTNVFAKFGNLLEKNIKIYLCAEVFRIKRNGGSLIEFYSIKSLDSKEIVFITDNNDNRFYRKLLDFLQFNPVCDLVCEKYGIEHGLNQSEEALKKDIKIALINKLIPEMDSIITFSNKNTEYCLAYYPLNKRIPKETPAWDSFLNQIDTKENVLLFRAWVYSIFKDDNFGRQALWISGTGTTGKSVISRVIYNRLAMINRSIVGTVESFHHQDKFSSASFVGKRYIMYADATDRSALRRQLLKNITGNDIIATRNLNTVKTSNSVYSKVMITSNQFPFVDADKPEEMSRVILIQVDYTKSKIAKNKWHETQTEEWENVLLSEMDDFLYNSEKIYYDMLQEDKQNLKISKEAIDNLTGLNYALNDLFILWWDCCVNEIKENEAMDVMTTTDIKSQFKRFGGEKLKKLVGNKQWLFNKNITIMLRIKGIEIFDLGVAAEQFIKGYTIHNYKITADELVEKELQAVKEGKEKRQIFK